MSPALDKQICEKYPSIFVNRNESYKNSCMAWGFSCGDGWYDIIDNLCEACTNLYSTGVSLNPSDAFNNGGNAFLEISPPKFIASQVKEKFGTLRFYYRLEFDKKASELQESGRYPEITQIFNSYNSYIDGIIHLSEIISSKTCEVSGKAGELHVSGGHRGGWYRTLNIEEAKTNPSLAERKFVPVKSLPKNKDCIIEE